MNWNPTVPPWLLFRVFGLFGPILVGAIGFLLWRATIWARRWLLTGAKSPAAIMEVGGSDSVVTSLYLKERWSLPDQAPITTALPVTFNMQIKSGSNVFALTSPSVVTSQDGNTTVTVKGLAIGHGVLEITGTDANGETYEALELQVHVVAADPSAMHLYEVAALIGRDYWFNTLMGNLIINERKLPPKGLCDQWADWGADFLSRNEKGQICTIYRTGTTTHALLRVRLCNGQVYYLDPWHKFGGSQVVYSQAQWEGDNGGPPDPTALSRIFTSSTCQCEMP